ncbi:hypothetical protein QR680_004031 [Steinernema hermaphroditum]|uniref:Uncharacterized protein n=1 Tax=Steinernema hermaphroditum TaxID=289476 RepID=A0AA39LT09_9BILA|nr:hypothetical protein QR680_004031 [Steinernema hermaphroditum]
MTFKPCPDLCMDYWYCMNYNEDEKACAWKKKDCIRAICSMGTWGLIANVWHLNHGPPPRLAEILHMSEVLSSVEKVWITVEHIRMFITVFIAFVAVADYRAVIKNGLLNIVTTLLADLKIRSPDKRLFKKRFNKKRPSAFQKTVLYIGDFTREFTLHSYMYFSTLTIFLAYMAYSKPFFFKKLAKRSTMIILASFGHLFAFVSVCIFAPQYPLPVSTFGISEGSGFTVIMIMQLFILLTLYVAMLVLYVLAIIKMRKNITMSSSSSSILLAHRKMLKSILIYCTPPNLFAILAFQMPTFIMLFISLRIFLMYTNFILSALLLYLSVRVVLPSLSRSYCLNLGVPAFFYTVCRVTQEQIYYYKQVFFFQNFDNTSHFSKRPSTFETVVLYLGYFGQEFILYDYVYFSTLTIFLAYIAYAKPILFKKLATTRAMVLMAILGHSFALGSVLIVSPNYPLLVDLFKPTKSKVFAMVMAVQLVVLFIIYVAMVILYILAIIELRKNIALLGAASPIVLSHRKMLKSLLIYCTPPNVFAILAFR